MKNLITTISLMLCIPFAWSADFQADDSKIAEYRVYAATAGAAVSAEKCGIPNIKPEEVLAKIGAALRCEYDDGKITADEGDEIMMEIANVYGKAKQADIPSTAVCRSVYVLVTSFLETDAGEC
jgi:hypothetical protein